MDKLVNIYRPILIKYLQTKRTLEDATQFFELYKSIETGRDLLDIFAVMVAGENNRFSKELQAIGKRLTIGLLTYPKIDFELGEVIERFKIEVSKVVKDDVIKLINKRSSEKDNRYWIRMLEDMDSLEYYDDFIKNLIVVRNELLGNLDKSKYNRDIIMDAFDIEFIKQIMYTKTYRFIGIYNFVYEFILDKLHPVLHTSFIELCESFIKESGILVDDTSNSTSIKLLQFIINNMIEFLYFEVSEG
jgi:hypothetical protein